MLRKIIKIDEEKCVGCSLCAQACQEGAIGMVDGKAKLLREDYCDGLGNCLPACPTEAITFEEREAPAYDADAVKAAQGGTGAYAGGCPGAMAQTIERKKGGAPANEADSVQPKAVADDAQSELKQWPVQIKLVPVNAPYFKNADLLIAADCVAYARANFHKEFMRGKITLIGCPKLDDVDYSEKLTEIIRQNDIKSVTIVRMEVPCCGGLEDATTGALKKSGKFIPWQVVTIGTDGNIKS